MILAAAEFEIENDANKTLKKIISKYGRLNNGAAGAMAYMEMAKYYKEKQLYAQWQSILDTLIKEKYYGRHGYWAFSATQQLLAHYEKNGDTILRNDLLKNCYLKIADDHQKNDRMGTVVSILDKVMKKYPGSKKQHYKVARQKLDAILKVQPELEKLLSKPDEKNTIYFSSIEKDFITMKKLNRNLSNTDRVSVELWFKQDYISHHREFLISRHANNKLGFYLALENKSVYWVFSDGKRDYMMQSAPIDTGKWTHVLATVAPDSARLFINGKLVAERTTAGVANDGAGRLRLGKGYDLQSGFFNGMMRFACVYLEVIHPDKDSFKPGEKPIDETKSDIYIIPDKNAIARDIKNHPLDIRIKEKTEETDHTIPL